MARLLKLLVSSLALATALNATMFFDNSQYDEDFVKMQQLMSKLTNNFMSDMSSAIGSYPKVNIQEKQDKYILTFNVAGVAKKDLKLSLKDNVLILEGKSNSENETKKDSFIRHEIYMGEFRRVIQLPNDVIVDKMSSKYKDGILTVTIPKVHKKSTYKVLKID